ncbi:phosphoribosylformylglycinamidine synthase subunit PurL [Ignavibacteria bacterium CHB1]|nr:MAG: phosphoribosylformylglycinamidine synthase subunit PurL [Chlorobiota bacterium]MBV6398768.1 Phosphoribosylformylglycinamidine synthase subunit PurL [Ignavibacteria bacterium]MCC6885060.1 phosphoribosylformylglycinamidine synthase subunit PurL [Ignavibacteriales bacterium]MCE7952149.1 phosphoribosylformylglycinamidine synthase subunit PurL [Chlorobi bacterium CHB7]MDL1886294.1 phosphoribosylformylglycinamidine synthase subunit PurL [Ignavibacteria bacterium CHB1]RIK49449.1 MAG: phosphor
MTYPVVNKSLAFELGLLEEEYEKILSILGRTPTYTELGIYSVMWSEHCSYKNSILKIKTLPRSGGKLLVNAGEENAGLIDIGEGLAVAFKIESHNHPSAVEPYQGAATGVGGILRDIFTMGARPVAALNSLRFGKLNNERNKFLFRNVVKGIGDYGNCFGVPTISGEIYFEESYNDNPLVNAMAVGLVRHDKTATAKASGIGNPVFIVGSATGKDGIHGATFASEEISDSSESKRPSVQVGDPFTEKLLLEATLELINSEIVVGIQDMGAAGITCSTSEMSAKGDVGMKINLDEVPLRDSNMTAYEIMLSESQERMLVVIKKGQEDKAREIFEKWDLNCALIGEVTRDKNIKIFYKGKLEADVPARSLVLGGDAPVYQRESKVPDYIAETTTFDAEALLMPDNFNNVLSKLLSDPDIANKKWVYSQYDSQVMTNSIVLSGGDASVIRIKGSKKGVAMKVDCNSRYVYLNPYVGAMISVAESCRNVVCTGASPLGITNCLNFGNPYDPEVYYQFSEAVRGIGDACRKFNTPVTGGNVSFYNESQNFAIIPTPVIGVIGLIDDVSKIVTSDFKQSGDYVILIGKQNSNEVGGSQYLKTIHDKITGKPPLIDLDFELNLHNTLLRLMSESLLNSCHDISDGGIAVALAECCITGENKTGCKIEMNFVHRDDFELFGETQSRVIASTSNAEKVIALCKENNLDAVCIGQTGGDRLIINEFISSSIADLAKSYFTSIGIIMD